MDLTLDRTALLAALRLVRRAAGRASTCPGLDAVLVAAGSDGADRASLAATDLAVGLTQSIDAAVAEPGRALLPVRLLLDLVAGLPDGPLQLQRDEAEPFGGGRGAVTIIAGEVRIDIAGRPPEDHPGVPPGAPGGTPILDAASLARTLAYVQPALRAGEDRPGLAGALVEIEHDRLVISASDGFRLARGALPYPPGGRVAEGRRAIVPKGTLMHFRRTLGASRTARLGIGQTGDDLRPIVSLVTERITVVSRVIDARAPEFAQAIPQRWTSRMNVDLPPLRRAVRLAMRLGEGEREDPAIVLLPSRQRLHLVARRDDGGATIATPVAGELDGVEAPVVMGARQLWDPLRLTPGPRVSLEWSGASGPMVVRAPAADPGAPALWVVMPQHNPQALERETRHALAA